MIISEGCDVKLDLGNHIISGAIISGGYYAQDYPGIKICDNGKLEIYGDGTIGGAAADGSRFITERGIYLSNSCELVMRGGTITGVAIGIYVIGCYSKVNIIDGLIENCDRGVVIYYGALSMSGGSIRNNSKEAIFPCNSDVKISNGTIVNNGMGICLYGGESSTIFLSGSANISEQSNSGPDIMSQNGGFSLSLEPPKIGNMELDLYKTSISEDTNVTETFIRTPNKEWEYVDKAGDISFYTKWVPAKTRPISTVTPSSSTPTMTATPTPTVSATPSVTPAATQTPTPTVTPSATPTQSVLPIWTPEPTSSVVKVKKPGTVKIKKAKTTKMGIHVTWKKVPYASGYQIQYSTKKNMKSAITKKAYTPRYSIKKYKKKKKYYIRIRAFSMVYDITKYGKWSKKKVIKTRK
jgi:hypothetical protein